MLRLSGEKERERGEEREESDLESLALALALQPPFSFLTHSACEEPGRHTRGARNEPNDRTNGKEKVLQYLLLTCTHSSRSHTHSLTHTSPPFSSGQIPPTRTRSTFNLHLVRDTLKQQQILITLTHIHSACHRIFPFFFLTAHISSLTYHRRTLAGSGTYRQHRTALKPYLLDLLIRPELTRCWSKSNFGFSEG